MFFCFVHAQAIFEVKEISAQISQLEAFVWKRLCIETICFLSFACPIFAYSGETLEESSKIFVDTVPMPGLITMTLVQWAQLWLSVYQQTDARTRDKTVETFTFQDAYDYEYQVFLILSGVRACASVILAGTRGSRRHSTTSFRTNVVEAKTRYIYQMSEVLSFWDRESA